MNFEKDVLSKKTHDLDLLCGGLARQYRTIQPRSKRQKMFKFYSIHEKFVKSFLFANENDLTKKNYVKDVK